MTTETKLPAEINRQPLHLLFQESGIIKAVRLLKQFTVNFGDYTKANLRLQADDDPLHFAGRLNRDR